MADVDYRLIGALAYGAYRLVVFIAKRAREAKSDEAAPKPPRKPVRPPKPSQVRPAEPETARERERQVRSTEPEVMRERERRMRVAEPEAARVRERRVVARHVDKGQAARDLQRFAPTKLAPPPPPRDSEDFEDREAEDDDESIETRWRHLRNIDRAATDEHDEAHEAVVEEFAESGASLEDTDSEDRDLEVGRFALRAPSDEGDVDARDFEHARRWRITPSLIATTPPPAKAPSVTALLMRDAIVLNEVLHRRRR